MGIGYAGALAVSVGIASYSRVLFAGLLNRLTGSKLVLINAFIGWIAGAMAGACNLTLMRYKEMLTGITVYNKEGTVCYGKSKAAGRKAILESSLSRFILPFPCYFIPATANLVLDSIGVWPKAALAGRIMETALVFVSLMIAIPMSTALF
jgi:hypothetical protein